MKTFRRFGGFLFAAAFLVPSPGGAQPGAPPASISLPGGSAGIGFDDLQYSAALGRVLVPAGRTGALALVEPGTGVVTTIGGFSSQKDFGGGHGEGITSVSEGRGLLFVTDRSSLELDVLDPGPRKIVARARLASSPDYVRYVEPTGEIWVTEPDKDRIEVFVFPSGASARPAHAGFISVPGGPESLVVDSSRKRAYSNLWTGTTVSIDLKSRAIAERWPNGCQDSRGIALDASRGFLFAGCAEGTATVLDVVHGGRELGRAKSGFGVDIIDYDSGVGHLYFPGAKSATMAIIGVAKNGALSVLGTFPTAPSAHCVASDRRGIAYVCDPKRGSLLPIRDPYPPSLR
jgi:hypothetical protein